ncbi:Phage Terminase [Pseudooctadecabacter jejudonensis]|uniref:Phage Terminase n=2 Tax=Pseudooctadecabacter jejudonensis TaxID=1391910 RepID=A0A1Y5R728_9RHOB|nr:Phage Terminase [Pseudooctadecabacter jejudonensis]
MTDADKVIEFAATLKIPEGPKAGEPLVLCQYQQAFIRGALEPDTEMAILTIARGNAKTALAAVIALAHLIGVYDTQPRREVLLAALTRDQAKIAWQFVLGFSESLPDDVQEQLTIRRGSKLEIEFSGHNGGIVKALAAEGKSNLGSAPTLVVLDEFGFWSETKGRELEQSLLSGLGKRAGRALIISTSAPSDTHPLSQLIDNPPNGTFVLEFRAPDGKPADDLDGILAANPGASEGVGSSVAWLQKQADRAIARGGSALTSFRLLNLNQRLSDETRDMLLTVDQYLAIETDKVPKRQGDCIIGIDMGGAVSMSCAAFYWPETGRLECLGAFGSEPTLAARGEADGVKDRYVEMNTRGELKTIGGQVVPIAAFLRDTLSHVDGENVVALVADRYRQAEFTESLVQAGIRVPVVWRGFGFKDGNEDATRFQRACFDEQVFTAPSLLLRSAFADAVCLRDPANNIKITKARSKGRIDAASASVIAIAEGQRRIARPVKGATVVGWV